MVFFNFLNFFAIFLEFSIPGQVRTHPNDFFSFHSFRAFPNLFWLEKKPYWCFLIFLIFALFFWNSLFRVGQELIGTIFFLDVLSWPFPSQFGQKRSQYSVFKFFLLFFCNSLFRVRQELIGTIFSVFTHSRPSPPCFCLKRSHNGVFQFFEFLCYFFGILYSGSGRNSSKRFLFIYFHSLTAILNLFWPEKKQYRCFFYFFAITLEFSIPGRVGTHRNDFFIFIFIFIFTLSWPFLTYFGLKISNIVVF